MKSLAVFVLAAACSGHEPNQPPNNVAHPATQVTAPAPAVLDPPPPAGVVVPTIGKPRDVARGPERAAEVWSAKFDVAADDPRIVAVVEKHRPHSAGEKDLARRIEIVSGKPQSPWTPGAAGAELYLDQIRATGIETDDTGYKIQNGALEVIVLWDSDHITGWTPTTFEIIVSLPGG